MLLAEEIVRQIRSGQETKDLPTDVQIMKKARDFESAITELSAMQKQKRPLAHGPMVVQQFDRMLEMARERADNAEQDLRKALVEMELGKHADPAQVARLRKLAHLDA